MNRRAIDYSDQIYEQQKVENGISLDHSKNENIGSDILINESENRNV